MLLYGAKCDGVTDDSAAFEAAISAASANCIVRADQGVVNQGAIDLPAGSTCKINSPLVIDGSCAGIRGNGGTMDFSGVAPQSVAITVTSSHPASPFGDNSTTWDNFALAGPGPASGTTALLVETGEAVFKRLTISGFGTGLAIGSYGFVDHFEQFNISNVDTGLSCGATLQDAGENISLASGSISNARLGINNQSCEINGSQLSFSALTSTAVNTATTGGGLFRCVNCSISYSQAISDPVFDIGACNAWEFIDWLGGSVSSTTAGPNVLALVRDNPSSLCGGSGSWATFRNVSFNNLNPTGGCDSGSGATCAVGSNASQVLISNIDQVPPVSPGSLASIGGTAFSVGSYGAACDGNKDDSAAIQAAINAAAQACGASAPAFVDLPMASTCKVNSPLALTSSCVSISGNGSALDFSSLSSGAAITISSPAPGSSPIVIEALHLIGPGSGSATTGLAIATGPALMERVDIHDFGTGISFSGNAADEVINEPFVWGVSTGIACPSLSGYPAVTINAGGIAGASVGISNQGCSMVANSISIDGLQSSPVVNATSGAGDFSCTNCHIEFFSAISAPVFVQGSCNQNDFVHYQGGVIMNDTGANGDVEALFENNTPTSCIGSGSSGLFSDTFFGAINPSVSCAAGSGAACIIGNDAAQVTVLESTNGNGGGSLGNTHVP